MTDLSSDKNLKYACSKHYVYEREFSFWDKLFMSMVYGSPVIRNSIFHNLNAAKYTNPEFVFQKNYVF